MTRANSSHYRILGSLGSLKFYPRKGLCTPNPEGELKLFPGYVRRETPACSEHLYTYRGKVTFWKAIHTLIWNSDIVHIFSDSHSLIPIV